MPWDREGSTSVFIEPAINRDVPKAESEFSSAPAD